MEMDVGAKRWIEKTARANHWRVSRWIDFEDLVQDGYLWYYATVARYCYRPRTRAHVMALFKRTFTNYLHDLANYKRRLIDVETAFSLIIEAEDKDNSLREGRVEVSDDGQAASEMFLLAGLSTAPEPVQRLLTFAASDSGAKALRESPYRHCACGCGARETTDQRLGRLIGRSRTFNYRRALKAFVAGEPRNYLADLLGDELDHAAAAAGIHI